MKMRLLIVIGVVLCHVTNSMQTNCSSTSNSIFNDRRIFTRVFNQFSLSLFQVASEDANTVVSHYDSYSPLHSFWKQELTKNKDVALETSYDIGSNCPPDDITAHLNGIFALHYNKLATRIFYHEGIGTEEAWMNLGSFSSPPKAVNFSNLGQTRNLINEWYKSELSETDNLTETTDLGNGIIAFKSDVIVFNGIWEKPFILEAQTARNNNFNFKPSDSIRYMYAFGNFIHGKLRGLDATFCGIPYKTDDTNNAISMFFILPGVYTSINELTNNLHEITLDKLLSGEKTKLFVEIPKFEIKTKSKAFIPFNEEEWNMPSGKNTGNSEGTPVKYVESFFSVKVVVDDGSASAFDYRNDPNVDTFNANRPFIFLIATTTNNPTILFTGRFSNPDL